MGRKGSISFSRQIGLLIKEHWLQRVCLLERSDIEQKMASIQGRLQALDGERRGLVEALSTLERELVSLNTPAVSAPTTALEVVNTSPPAAKVALFRDLFAGRTDVVPLRWDNQKTGRSGYSPGCSNEWVRGICNKPKVRCGNCLHQAFIPVTDDLIARHLRGGGQGDREVVAGVYPLMKDETCRFLAADFDKTSWAEDASALMQTCKARNVPAALERSRSGNGGHVWIFFAEPVSARLARRLGAALITETMETRPEIGFKSYDRLFPNQDTMPSGGFGNLIALPLQGRAREKGGSVFINEALQPYEDQWAFLSSMPRLSADDVQGITADAEREGRILGVRMPVEDENADEPWLMPPSRRVADKPFEAETPLPERIKLVMSDQVYIDRTDLPPALTTRIIRLAAFQNPEFYRAQAMRFPTYGKPRVISCAELHPKHIALPRGCLDEARALLDQQGVVADLEDLRETGTALPEGLQFAGELRPEQVKAFDALIPHDCGVLAATTAFGKTVLAAAMIAKRGQNALILVHRRELLDQWIERLRSFLDINPKLIGTIGGGRRKPTGVIDVATIQSLVRKGEVSDIVADYGHVIVDECHHLSASSFELVARRSKAKFVLGLSATVARKDGHHPIIFMQCGPVRHRVGARQQALERGIAHHVRERVTEFTLPLSLTMTDRPAISDVYSAIVQDERRNDLIFDDVLLALEAKRSPIVLTERKDHLDYLQGRFSSFVKNVAVLRGGMSAAERRTAEAALKVPEDEERLIIATGRYIGEGFDDARLDTLFLTMPISWKGTLAQYVGRLHRQHDGKTDVLVVDYVDAGAPVLSRMAAKRRSGYRALGYTVG